MEVAEEPTKAAIPDYDDQDQIEASSGGEGWHPDLPRVEFAALNGKAISVLEVDFRDSTFDTPEEGKAPKQYALIRFACNDVQVPGTDDEDKPVKVQPGEEATTSCGGVRVVEQLKKRAGDFPVRCEIGKVKTTRGYDMWELKPVSA